MSTLAALLFATHPVHTESVSGIVGRGDLLACVLFLGSFILYTRGVEPKYKLSAQCNLLHISWPIGEDLPISNKLLQDNQMDLQMAFDELTLILGVERYFKI